MRTGNFILVYCSYEQYTIPMNNAASGIYHPRNPTDSSLWNVLNNHYDDFEKHYEEKYEKKYGYFRPVIKKVVEEYLKCGNLKEGFARVRCPQFVFSIPIILRLYFKYNRKLLTKLCRCAYESLLEFLRITIGLTDGVPGVVMTIHIFGNYMEKFHPHLHALVSDGFFEHQGPSM